MDFDPSLYRFGTARFCNEADLEAAGLFKPAPDAIFIGFFQGRRGLRALWYKGAGGLLCTAGARAGKFRDFLAYNICQRVLSEESLLVLDPKLEAGYVAQYQVDDGKFCLYWNPSGLFGFAQHRLNPFDTLTKDSKTLFADAKVLAENLIPSSGSPQGAYFEGRAREYLEAFILIIVMLEGVLTFPRLYEVLNLIPGAGDQYLDLAFEMNQSGIPLCVRVEEEIAAARDNPTGGFSGILGELLKSVACGSDPNLMASVSPPFDASLADLCKGARKYQVYLCPEVEHLSVYAPIIRALIVNAVTHRGRNPSAPRLTVILDELAQLGAFPLATKLFSVGAGRGVRPLAIYQSAAQMKATGKNAELEIPASAQCRISFAVRDFETARVTSAMCGTSTLEYVDELAQLKAQQARNVAAMNVLTGGADPFQAANQITVQNFAANHRQKQARALLDPAEVLTLPGDRMLVFLDGLPGPILALRKPYYEHAPMAAARYFPNPYHPPLDRLRVCERGAFGRNRYRWRRVIEERVPKRIAAFPQYASGQWRRLK